jgi:WD40 repeat protein
MPTLIWDVASGEQLQRLPDTATCAAFSPDGRHVAIGSHGSYAILVNSVTGRLAQEFRGHTEYITAVAFSPDGKQLLTGSMDERAILWDVASGELLQSFPGHSHAVECLAFSPNGRRILTGPDDRTAILWDAVTGDKLQVFQGDATCAAFSPDGRHVLIGDWRGASLWDTDSGQAVRRFGTRGRVETVMFTRDGRSVRIGADSCPASEWDIATGKQTLDRQWPSALMGLPS